VSARWDDEDTDPTWAGLVWEVAGCLAVFGFVLYVLVVATRG
jgi:hypothetical protein